MRGFKKNYRAARLTNKSDSSFQLILLKKIITLVNLICLFE